jgi:hypothetical protein
VHGSQAQLAMSPDGAFVAVSGGAAGLDVPFLTLLRRYRDGSTRFAAQLAAADFGETNVTGDRAPRAARCPASATRSRCTALTVGNAVFAADSAALFAVIVRHGASPAVLLAALSVPQVRGAFALRLCCAVNRSR